MSAKLIDRHANVAIYEILDSDDETRLDALLDIYTRLFPQYMHYVPRMRARAKLPSHNPQGHVVHYWLVEVDGQPAGIRTFRYIPNRRCGIAISLAVLPEYRSVTVNGNRLAVHIINKCLFQIMADAQAAGDPPPFGIVNEVESERLMQHNLRNGHIELPLEYVEPIFPRNRGERRMDGVTFERMHLGFLPNPEFISYNFTPDQLADFALAFLVDHYDIPEEHPAVQTVIQSISIPIA